jgi:hypothetical protein
MQHGHGLLDHPTVQAEAAAMGDASAGNVCLGVSGAAHRFRWAAP